MRPAKGDPDKTPWLFLAHLSGDARLREAAFENVQKLAAVRPSGNLNLALEVYPPADYHGPTRCQIDGGDQTHRADGRKKQPSDKLLGASGALTSFLEFYLEPRQFEHRLLVIGGHGAGFRTLNCDTPYDDPGLPLSVARINTSLRRAGLTAGRKLSVLGFDACLMSMIEVVHHFRNSAEIIVGSQQTEPVGGWPYDQVYGILEDSPSPMNLSRRIVAAYISEYERNAIFDITLSAMETKKTPAVISAIGQLGSALAFHIVKYRDQLKRLRPRIQSFAFSDYIDLIHFASHLAVEIGDPRVASISRRVVNAARASVIASRSYGNGVKNANGLSIWFPFDARMYYAYRSQYMALSFSKTTTGWIDFLDSYFA